MVANHVGGACVRCCKGMRLLLSKLMKLVAILPVVVCYFLWLGTSYTFISTIIPAVYSPDTFLFWFWEAWGVWFAGGVGFNYTMVAFTNPGRVPANVIATHSTRREREDIESSAAAGDSLINGSRHGHQIVHQIPSEGDSDFTDDGGSPTREGGKQAESGRLRPQGQATSGRRPREHDAFHLDSETEFESDSEGSDIAVIDEGLVGHAHPEEAQHLLSQFETSVSDDGRVRIAMGWCRKCQKSKPPRAHHCSICGTCILKLDHHCPWVNNCVGHFNHRYFIMFLINLVLLCIGCIIAGMPIYIDRKAGRYRIHVYFTYVLAVSAGIVLSGFAIFHLYLALTAQSTIELMINQSNKRNAKRQGKEFVNFYDHGMAKNFEHFFGVDRWWKTLLPSRRDPHCNGVNWPLRSDIPENAYLQAA
eukprot:GFYU01000785.1.p1 GENE.GFYU01000785.1~~GFYU01000785.1.p1  ORF type:complete len:419 (-),score=70.61 GFYU01000785.1:188-1444(-)